MPAVALQGGAMHSVTTSMSEFLALLDRVRAGTVPKDQFLAAVDHQLRHSGVTPGTLLAALGSERVKAALPLDVHREAVRRVKDWMAAPVGVSPSGWEENTDTVVNLEAVQRVLVGGKGRPGLTPHAAEVLGRAATPARVGTLLKQRFQLIERIGSGGMSTVFKAVDRRRTESNAPDPYVAVKMLNLTFLDYAAALALLQREAQKLQILAHPNIVRVIDCDRDDSLVFMTMEYLSGESLKFRLQAHPSGLQVGEAGRVLEGIAGGLIFAHESGIVHGDLKPANVLLTTAGQVKVIDFGVARIVNESLPLQIGGPASTTDSNLALTPQYASPEMLDGKSADPRDDVYALGCITSELFCGQHPFDRKSATDARAAGLTPRHAERLSRRQYKALCGALQFEREKRSPSVKQFLLEFNGKPESNTWRFVGLAAAIAVACAIGAVALLKQWPSASSPRQTVLAAGTVFRDCPTCPLMKVLPSGRFQQGSAADTTDATALEYPRHAVTIGYPIGMGVYDVTVAEFKEFVDATGRQSQGCWTYDGAWHEQADLNWRHVGYEQSSSHPVTCVSWQDAVAYADWLSHKTQQHYRLPTASEWEYAAGAGSPSARPWGQQPEAACQDANVADATAATQFPGWKVLPCRDGYVFSSPVGSFAPNAFGLYDALGNVFQWVQDCWHENYQSAPQDGSAWDDGDCGRREVRGGSWFTDPAYVRTTYRNRFAVDYRTNSVGFRIARVVK
jgi:formylglycine-generating enzyme required for sulfatase activity/predicted Ser/Thr protein kinase